MTTIMLVFAWIKGFAALASLILAVWKLSVLIKRRRRQAKTKKPTV
ncbi:hypothetical protein [Paenibacillus hubeiensis]